MLIDYLKIRSLSIVFIGNFNPSILQPFWLANKKLIKEQEADAAKVDLIHPEIVRFELDWLFVEMTPTRLELRSSKESYFDPVRDLAKGIFTYLSEIPIDAGAINHTLHFALPDADKHYKVGDKLAPLSNWSGFMDDPRMMRLDILENNRRDKKKGYLKVFIQPSDQQLSTPYSFSIIVNDHLDADDQTKFRSTNLVNTLLDNWDESFVRANEIVEGIWNSVTK